MTSDRLIGLAQASADMLASARDVYDAGFPAAVRAPFADLMDTRPDERLQILLAGGAGLGSGDVIGVTVTRDLGDLDWSFLRYFVVTARQRGQGIGGRLWSALCADLAARGQRRLLFDIEDPEDGAADPVEAEERRRRLRFYRRAGADLVEVDRYEPPHHGQPGTVAIPLRLMAAELDPAGRSTAPTYDAVTAASVVSAVMQHRYGITS